MSPALDPVAVAAVTVRLGPSIEQVAERAAECVGGRDYLHDHGTEFGRDSPNASPREVPPANSPAELAELAERPVDRLAELAERPVEPVELVELPDDSDPLLDLLAERHAAREERLFAS